MKSQGLSIGIFDLVLAHYKVQGQDHGQFDCEYCDSRASITIFIKYKIALNPSITTFRFDLVPL